jgi:hypothetical protein
VILLFDNYLRRVTSQGFGGGSGFFPGTPGGSASASTPPAPVINLLNGTTASPYAGQLISLQVSAPNGWNGLGNQTWTYGNANDVVGGYNASSASGAVVPAPATNTASLSYHYIVPGQQETMSVTVTYTLADGSTSARSAAATQTFSVGGPTGTFQPKANLQTGISGSIIGTYSSSNGCVITTSTPTANPACLSMGNSPQNPTVGIWFQEPAVPPKANPGRFIWLQILNSVNYSAIYTQTSGYSLPNNALNQLDGLYPYPSQYDVGQSQNPPTTRQSNLTSDTPAMGGLVSAVGEAAKQFDATMTVLWDPAIPPAGQQSCTPASVNTSTKPYTVTPSTCISIPVPLGAIDWSWNACSINALTSPGPGAFTSSWFVQCGVGTQTTYETSDYPKWTSCYKSAFGGCQ